MPHLILEYSHNIIEKKNLLILFQKCHQLLTENLSAELGSCKSRAIEHTDFLIGDGQKNNAFVHINLKIMPGRTATTLQVAGQSLLTLCQDFFATSCSKLNLQISVEIIELEKTYFKLT